MTTPTRQVTVQAEEWPIAGTFRVSRGEKTTAEVVVVELREGEARGRGEAVPYSHYGESAGSVVAAVERTAAALEEGLNRESLSEALPRGAARNAVDCALWDLEASLAGRPVWQLAGLAEPRPVVTAYTISLDEPPVMGAKARRHASRPLLKLKVEGQGDLERVRAVRQGAPDSRIVVDANEGWSDEHLASLPGQLAELGVEMIEQPLPAGRDQALASTPHPLPLCADESCLDATSVPALVGRYDMVNVKLDKSGGLTEAIRVAEAARAAGLGVMVGCMVATSLSMAPALLLAGQADLVDLDGPLLLERDRAQGIRYEGSVAHPAPPELWGRGRSRR